MSRANVFIESGTIVRDIIILGSRRGIATTAIAVDREWFKDGEIKKKTSFFNLKMYNTSNSFFDVFSNLKKGQRVCIGGYLEKDSWVDKKTNERKYDVVLIVEAFSVFSPSSKKEDTVEEDIETSDPSEPARRRLPPARNN